VLSRFLDLKKVVDAEEEGSKETVP